MQIKVPFLSFNPVHLPLKSEMMKTFESFFDSNWFVLGDRVNFFEQEYASFNQVNHVIGVSNGLDALHLALRVLNIGVGDEVIVPSNTYIATLLAVSYVGAKPVLVEPNIHTYNIEPTNIEAAITPNTKAIMPVHLYGQCCEMGEIMRIAKENKLFVIEDNAQAQGSAYLDQQAGSFGDINGTSFYPGKNLGALGDAGAVTTNSEKLAKKVKVLRNYGSQKKYYNDVIGYNMRLDELQAAFLSVKLKHLPEWTKERQKIATWYDETLNGIGDLVMPVIAEGATHVYHLYVVRTQLRDALQKHLEENGVGTMIHYPVPPHLQNAYLELEYKKSDFPIAEEIADTCLSLPLWPGMQKEDVVYVCDSINSFFTSNN
jgi:dTDP-4-amino-4,6-dideoxygalactose transaminase